MNDNPLILAAAALRNAAPREWDAFLVALGTRHQTKLEHLSTAPRDSVFGAQGRAQELTDLLVLLRDADKNAAKIQRRP